MWSNETARLGGGHWRAKRTGWTMRSGSRLEGGEAPTPGAALEGVRPRKNVPSEPALREPSPPDDLAAAAQGQEDC